MMRKLPIILGSLFGSFLIAGIAPAASVPEIGKSIASGKTTAVISAPDDIAVGRTIILDASASHSAGERTQYVWTIEETKQVIGRNVEAIFTPEKTGTFTFRLTVKSTDLSGKTEQVSSLHPVVVFRKKIVLIADASADAEAMLMSEIFAEEEGVFLKIIRSPETTGTLGAEDDIYRQLAEQKTMLLNASSIVIWSDGIAGVQALMRAAKADPDTAVAMGNQSIVLITNRSLGILARSTRGAYSFLKPKEIIISRKEAMKPLIASENSTAFSETMAERGIENLAVNEATFRLRFWDIVSILVNYLLSHGVSGQTVILLLMLPVIATIFSFLKQVVGITTFGLYTPSIVALSFLALGWWIGLLFLLFILAVGYGARSFMKRWRLLYIPKVAIILAVLSFALLALVAFGTWAGLSFSRETVFILLILSTQAENFLNLKSEEGWMSAILGITETVSGALLCVLIVQWQLLQSLVLAYPELILLTILMNIFLGRWTGLRLVEYFRFREIFKHLAEEE